ncbi:uncharacterized protein LOC109846710 [Asparagus officinalis]|uniref:uncharacterized protein LOC109841948 n=1 Tax=Asparagus officinalis TaxID=4686 RepID=UPI00098E37F4|nr:uncharacterized protein LOC109841948 [Asparagus officinalis]XP_020271544.1 uncharacterized protein LOC109846710 [Asparagus officinalis]
MRWWLVGDIYRFFFLDDYACAWTYCFTQINLSFKRWRSELKKKYFTQRTEDWERYWHLDERVDGVDFFALCDYWDTAEAQEQAEIARRNRNAPRSYEHHGGSRSFSQHYHQLALEGRGELGHFADRILTGWSPNYADEVKKAQNRDLAEKLHAKVQEQLSQTQVDSNTPTRLSREEEDSIIETVIGPSRKNRYRWRGSEHRPYESSSTYESAAPPGCSSSQDPTMEQRMKAMEDWQSRRESELLQMAEEERRRREQRELEFTQFISTLPSDAQEAYRRRFLADQAGTSRQGGAGDEDDDQED